MLKKLINYFKDDRKGERLAEIEALIAMNCRNHRTDWSLRLASYKILNDLMV